MNYKAVYRTTPATPGLLITQGSTCCMYSSIHHPIKTIDYLGDESGDKIFPTEASDRGRVSSALRLEIWAFVSTQLDF